MQEAWEQLLRDGLLVAGAPFLATAFLILLLRPLAVKLRLVDHPSSARKIHSDPTPLVGGAAISFAALACGAWLLPWSPDLVALAAATLLMLVVGTFDDRYDINWRYRIVAQTVAALILYFVGGVRVESIGNALGFPGHQLGVLSLPFTVIATVGVTNAVNWADGVDGLAGSLTLAALAMLAAGAIYAGNTPLVSDLVLMGGCVAGFLAFNLRTPWQPQAKAFLGGGAEILGLWVAWASFRLTQTPGHPVTPVLAPFLIAPAVIDCLVLIFRRLRAGHSPFYADGDHLHHRLLKLGMSTTGVVAALTGVSLAIGFAAATARRAHVPEPWFPAIYLAATAGYFIMTRKRPARAAEGAPAPRPAKPEPARVAHPERAGDPVLAPIPIERGDA
jgi:UDP-GlcNAc:undecaprenyl-phosphate GlcNAc-1-phosphate transferase